MPGSFFNQQAAISPGGNHPNLTPAQPMYVSAGSTLMVVTLNQTSNPPTITDGGVGNKYNWVGFATNGNQWLHFQYASNCYQALTQVTSAGTNTQGFYLAEYVGLGPLLSSACRYVSGPGNGTDTLKTGNMPAVFPPGLGARIFAFAYDFPGGSDGGNTAGTGFVLRPVTWVNLGNGTAPSGYPEDRQLTIPGTYAGTLTIDSANGADQMFFGAMMFAEAIGPLVPFAPMANNQY